LLANRVSKLPLKGSEDVNDPLRRALAPTEAEIAAEPLTDNDAVAGELLAGRGRRALDIGCGNGRFTRILARLFPHATGIDVKADKIAEARDAAASAGLAAAFEVASGIELPFADRSLDVVAYSNSLHHMPDIGASLREALRVLVPGGALYVMEPVPAGAFYDITVPVNDETAVRTEAYERLIGLYGGALRPVAERHYRTRAVFRDFDQWKAGQIDVDPRRKARLDIHEATVRRNFEAQADRSDGRFSFSQPFRVNLAEKV
jgi:ubiquinone/menaquinone biosynthesis C-methylase UbiE